MDERRGSLGRQRGCEDAVITTDGDSVVTTWNSGAERLYGVQAGAAVGRPFDSLVRFDPGDAERAQARSDTLTAGQGFRDVMAVRGDGQAIAVELVAVALGDGGGQPQGILSIHRDVTEREQDERRLRYHASLLDNVHDGVIATDAEFRITAWNTGAERLYGYAAGEVLGRPANQVASFPGDASRDLLEAELLATGRSRIEFTAQRKDGSDVAVELIAVAVRASPDGDVLGYLGIHRDVTDRQRAEAEQRRLLAVIENSSDFIGMSDLEGRGSYLNPAGRRLVGLEPTAVDRSRRAHELHEAREGEQRRIARALHDEALQQLSFATSHAARMPAGGDRDQLEAALRLVGEHLRGAIHDLRLADEEDRPLGELLADLLEVHRRIAPDRTIELETEGLPPYPLGSTGTEVVRVLGEALTNARRHAGAGTATVRVWATDSTLRAAVRGDGAGFDPAVLPDGAGGAGLVGMRERAERMGGRLVVEARPGAGTSVQLAVPITAPHAEDRLRILLVEDHAAMREAIAGALEVEPDVDSVAQAGSLAEARTMLADIDVAVIDLSLTDGNGAELIQDLRQVSPGAQALVLSAKLDRSAVAHAVQSGAAGALSKATHMHEVVDAVRRLRRGETLMPLDEVVELLRFAAREREREYDDRRALETLTAREREILELLAEGLDNRGAAERLHISPRTHRNHMANILAKLGVHSQLQALLFALRHGVVDVRRERVY